MGHHSSFQFFKNRSHVFLCLALMMPFLQNCSGGFSSGGSSGGSDAAASGTPSPGSTSTPAPSPVPVPNPMPAPAECPEESLANAYNTSVTNHVVTQDEIAKACVDEVTDYQSNINFPSTDLFRIVRFQTTCAARWCDKHFNSKEGVGVVKSEMVWNGSALDVAALVNVQCRSAKAELISDACTDTGLILKPLETFTLGYSDPRCGFCGCDSATVASKWGISQQALIDCGTNFCKGENAGFHWGILSEVNNSAYSIRCSRATVK